MHVNNYIKGMGYMLQSKDTDWLNGYKTNTFIYVVYKVPSSDVVIHADWKLGNGKKVFHANGNQRKAGE